MSPAIKSITLEEHAAFPSLGASGPFYDRMWKVFPKQEEKAWDYSTKRIQDLDRGHVSFQVMSHIAGTCMDDPSRSRAANDEMAAAIAKHPTRLGGFAALPMACPEAAADELRRTVTELGFLGALIDNHLPDGTHYDDRKFWSVFAMAEKLDVPIYIHPAPPPQEALAERYAGNYSSAVQLGLATGAWGWHENVGLHVLKLYGAGVFDEFPNLKIVIGHMGEMLPMMLHRVDQHTFFKEVKRGIMEVWDHNIWVTMGGMFSEEALMMLLQVTKIEKVMFSVDYPFKSNIEGSHFLEGLRDGGKLSGDELGMIAFENAKHLLKLKL